MTNEKRDAERYQKLKVLHKSGRHPAWFEMYFEPDLDAAVDLLPDDGQDVCGGNVFLIAPTPPAPEGP